MAYLVLFLGLLYNFSRVRANTKKKVNFFLTLTYTLLFWFVFTEILNIIYLNFNTIDSMILDWTGNIVLYYFLNCFYNNSSFEGYSLFSPYTLLKINPVESDEDVELLGDFKKYSQTVQAEYAESGVQLFNPKKYNGPIDPNIFEEKIREMDQAISLEKNKNKILSPHNPIVFYKIVLDSGILSDKESQELCIKLFSSFLHTSNTNLNLYSYSENNAEFYKNIPNFLYYPERMENYLILDNKVYLSESFANNLDLDKSEFIIKNNKKWLFLISVPDLFFGELKTTISNSIEYNNSNIIPVNQEKYLEEWLYFSKYQYLWFIELNVPYYVNTYIFFNENLNKITINKFMYSNYLAAYEYNQELEFLLKAKQGYVEFMDLFKYEGTFFPQNRPLSENQLFFLKFWVRQLIAFNFEWFINPENTLENKDLRYIFNMFDLDLLKEELLENILFAQCKTYEAY